MLLKLLILILKLVGVASSKEENRKFIDLYFFNDNTQIACTQREAILAKLKY